jgi:hypothetical protein
MSCRGLFKKVLLLRLLGDAGLSHIRRVGPFNHINHLLVGGEDQKKL